MRMCTYAALLSEDKTIFLFARIMSKNNAKLCPLCFEFSKNVFTFTCPELTYGASVCTVEHAICLDCTNNYFTTKIKQRDTNVSCPQCLKPNLQVHSTEARKYIAWLLPKLMDVLSFKNHAQLEDMMLEHQKLFDPNFRRCQKCNAGFIATAVNSSNRHCNLCHQEKLCDDFAKIAIQQDSLASEMQLAEMRKQNGDYVWFKCDRCKLESIVEPPIDCLHMVCRCRHESCRGCNRPFVRDGNSQACRNLRCTYRGLHCHHPRFCAYYLRDFTADQLTSLLSQAGVAVPLPPAGNASDRKLCSGTDFYGSEPTPCRNVVVYKAFQSCVTHSQLFLARLVRQHRIDPLPIMDTQQCMQEVRRMGLTMPDRGPYDDDPKYKVICANLLRSYFLDFD